MNGMTKEILQYTLQYVEVHDLPNCCSVCHFWNLCMDDQFFSILYYNAGGALININNKSNINNNTNNNNIEKEKEDKIGKYKFLFFTFMLKMRLSLKIEHALLTNNSRLLSSLLHIWQLSSPIRLFQKNMIFMLAAVIGNVDVTRTVLRCLPDVRVDAKLERHVSMSAILFAIYHFNLDMIKFLVEEAHVDLKSARYSSETALYHAFFDHDAFRFTQYYKKIDNTNKDGNNNNIDKDLFSLICRPRSHNVDSKQKILVIEYLLQSKGNSAYANEIYDVNNSDDAGNALHWAISKGDIAISKYMLENFYPKAKSHCFMPNQAVLNDASALQRHMTVWDDYSYLLAAYRSLKTSTLFWLLTEGGMDINSVSAVTDCTILHKCLADKKYDLAKELITKYGAKVNCGHKNPEHSLFHLGNFGQFDLDTYLLLREQGASIENSYGQQYLTHVAVFSLEMMKQLVADGVSLELKNGQGRTVADLVKYYSKRKGMEAMVEYMKELNAPQSDEHVAVSQYYCWEQKKKCIVM